jgi:hypothetical protein
MAPGMVKPREPVLVPTGMVNLTDHDSRPMRTHGYKPLQGYNAQLSVNERQVIIAELTTDSPDFGHLEPMVRAAQRELRGVEVGDPGVVLADAGYGHQRQIDTVVGDGVQVLVSPDSGLRQGPRPGWTGGLYDFMRPGPLPPRARGERLQVRAANGPSGSGRSSSAAAKNPTWQTSSRACPHGPKPAGRSRDYFTGLRASAVTS